MTSSPLNDLNLDDIVGVPISPTNEIRDSLEIERIGDSWIRILEDEGDLQAQPPYDSTFWKVLEAEAEEKVEVLEEEVLESGLLPDILGNDTDDDTEDEVEVEKPTIITSAGVMNFCKFCSKFCGEQKVCAFHRCIMFKCENKRTSKGMCNKHYLLSSRRCQFEGCRNMEVDKGLCRRHTGYKRKLCSENDCSNIARKGGVCVTHGAVSKRCSVDNCTKIAVKGGVCISHGAVHKRCIFDGCLNQVQIGGLCISHGAKVARCSVDNCSNKVQTGGVCFTHGAKITRCSIDGCTNQTRKGGVCIRHGAKTLRCNHPECNYKRQKDGLCGYHHPNQRKCINCQYFQVSIKGSMCSTCAGYRENSEEFKLRELINIWFQDLKIVHDKIIDGSCLRYRPDFFIETPKGHVIILEVDEDHHKQYDINCEIVRMFNIQQAIMTPIIFVRYNPDAYKPGGVKTTAVPKKVRYNKLRATITRLIHFPPTFLPGIPEVEYLYYPQPRVELLNEEYKQKINILM